MIAHNLPRTADGALPPPILPGNSSLEFNEMTEADEECQKYFIDRYIAERIPIDFWWMDAGWYPSSGWPQTGTWEPDLRRFPRGLRAISDHARTKGVRTLVWFEPERVAPGTYLREKHPEWLLGGTLLDLGKAEARAWLTDHVDRLLREQGIDLYRQDFNMDPLAYWRGNDAPDRQGITENFHIQGYLAYWDALRERHPQLVIDSCASGGRRNDLETLRRAVPLHPTDYNYAHLAAKQAFHQSLFRWVPYFGSNTVPVDTVDAYAFRSGHALSTVLGYDVRRKDLDYDLLRKLATTLRKIQKYYYADYYPLAPYTLAETDWIAWQFHDPETGSGLVEAFRRPRSRLASSSFRLRGLDAEAIYEFEDADAEGLRRFSGSELLELGLPVALPRRPQAATIVYRRLRGLAAAASPSAVSPEVGEPVTFTAVVSGAGPGEVASFRWDFGDGSAAEGPRVEHAYAAPGAYSVELVATGPGGAKDAIPKRRGWMRPMPSTKTRSGLAWSFEKASRTSGASRKARSPGTYGAAAARWSAIAPPASKGRAARALRRRAMVAVRPRGFPRAGPDSALGRATLASPAVSPGSRGAPRPPRGGRPGSRASLPRPRRQAGASPPRSGPSLGAPPSRRSARAARRHRGPPGRSAGRGTPSSRSHR